MLLVESILRIGLVGMMLYGLMKKKSMKIME